MKQALYIFLFWVLIACETDNRVYIKHYQSYRENPLESVDTAYLFIEKYSNVLVYSYSVNNIHYDTLVSEHCIFYPKTNVLIESNTPCRFRGEKVFIVDHDTFLVKKYLFDREDAVDEEHLTFFCEQKGVLIRGSGFAGRTFYESKHTLKLIQELVNDTTNFCPYRRE